jgi:hypothetical protein
MQPSELEILRARLLRAGVAPRHVRRFVQELRDHYDDALRVELAAGAQPATAQRTAAERLGSADALVQSMLERPELRSTAARFPALVFGLGPLVAWAALLIATAWTMRLSSEANPGEAQPAWLLDAAYAVCVVHLRVVPVVLGCVAFRAAAQRCARACWPAVGIGLVCLFAGTLTIQLFAGQLGVSSSLLPFITPLSDVFGPARSAALTQGLIRGAAMLGISVVAHRVLARLTQARGLA